MFLERKESECWRGTVAHSHPGPPTDERCRAALNSCVGCCCLGKWVLRFQIQIKLPEAESRLTTHHGVSIQFLAGSWERRRAAPPNDSVPGSVPARAWVNWLMVSAEGLLPGCLRRDPFGPCHLSALAAAGEVRGQEPQKVFWKKIVSAMLVSLFFPSVLHSTFPDFSPQNCPLFFHTVHYISSSRFKDLTHTHIHVAFDIL